MIFVAQPFLSTEKLRRAAYHYVRRLYPSAARVQRVNGGFAVFATAIDYQTWRNQK